MKTVIFAYVTFILLSVFVIFNSLFVSYNINIILERLESIPQGAPDASIYEDIYIDYQRRQKYISLTVSHSDLTSIEEEFEEILGSISANDTENLTIAKSRLIGALNHLRRLSGINIDSIF